MTLKLSKDCTRTLDVAIAEERVRYASERLDFHSYFDCVTVTQLQNIIRRETKPTDPDETRKELIGDLFRAQQASPHRLWELLILQAVERALVKRRQALSPADDTHLDELVVSTFVAVLQSIPVSVWCEDVQGYVLRVSRSALARKLREARGGPKRGAAWHAAQRTNVRRARKPSIAAPAVATESEAPR
jgi:hypothetical protein